MGPGEGGRPTSVTLEVAAAGRTETDGSGKVTAAEAAGGGGGRSDGLGSKTSPPGIPLPERTGSDDGGVSCRAAALAVAPAAEAAAAALAEAATARRWSGDAEPDASETAALGETKAPPLRARSSDATMPPAHGSRGGWADWRAKRRPANSVSRRAAYKEEEGGMKRLKGAAAIRREHNLTRDHASN